MCFALAMRLFFFVVLFFEGTCGSHFFLEHGVGFYLFIYFFIGTRSSFGCVHGEVRSFIEYGVVL